MFNIRKKNFGYSPYVCDTTPVPKSVGIFAAVFCQQNQVVLVIFQLFSGDNSRNFDSDYNNL